MNMSKQLKTNLGFTLTLAIGAFLLVNAPIASADFSNFNYKFNATTDTYISSLYKDNNYGTVDTVAFYNRTYLNDQTVAFLEYDLSSYGIANATNITLDWQYSGCSWSGATNSKYIQYEIIELLVDFDETGTTWNNNPCGALFDNSTACNITNSYKFNMTLSEACLGKTVYFTDWANSSLYRSQNLRFLIKPSFMNDTGFTHSGYSREYTGSKQKIVLFYEGNFTTPPVTTTIEANVTIGTITNDYIDGFAGFLAEMFGVDIGLGKMVFWIMGEFLLIYYLITKSKGLIEWRLGAFLFAFLLVVGSLVGFLPSWISIVFVVLSVALVAMWGTRVFSGEG